MSKLAGKSRTDSDGEGRRIRILIADDHPVFREGLKTVLDKPGLVIIGEAATGTEAIAQAAALKPDIILLDVRMPEMDGLQALRAIKAVNPGIPVVILTTYESNDFLWSAILGGAAGYILKGSSSGDLISLIRRVTEGETVLDPGQLQEMNVRFSRAPGLESGSQLDEEPSLTARERQILRFLADGLKNQDIARRLGVRLATVKSHTNHIFQKIRVSDRTQAVIWAYRHASLIEGSEDPSPLTSGGR